LRHNLQAQLDALRSGIEIVGLVVEELHPPAGAASAYRAVQAAQIDASAAIAQEQGRARGTASLALRDANDARDAALAQAAETEQAAATEKTRMLADDRAWRAGGAAFLMEQRFARLRASLGHAPLEIVDSRISARLLDLRAGAAGQTPDVPLPDPEGRSP
jgi:regulator of protease activity HflC (stomatin/prohibitin superfamily)